MAVPGLFILCLTEGKAKALKCWSGAFCWGQLSPGPGDPLSPSTAPRGATKLRTSRGCGRSKPPARSSGATSPCKTSRGKQRGKAGGMPSPGVLSPAPAMPGRDQGCRNCPSQPRGHSPARSNAAAPRRSLRGAFIPGTASWQSLHRYPAPKPSCPPAEPRIPLQSQAGVGGGVTDVSGCRSSQGSKCHHTQ